MNFELTLIMVSAFPFIVYNYIKNERRKRREQIAKEYLKDLLK